LRAVRPVGTGTRLSADGADAANRAHGRVLPWNRGSRHSEGDRIMMQDHTPPKECSVCGRDFAIGDFVVRYFRWKEDYGKAGNSGYEWQIGHHDCLSKVTRKP
jgi:hypothetical protein